MDDDTIKITEKIEYDAAIGGRVPVDPEVMTFRYGHSHMNEITALTEAVENPSSKKLVFQKLPKHMRRRAMSHNPNRLPRKYRLAHIGQMNKSGEPAQTKRPSRKYRRKPQNLMVEYQRRKRKAAWLETHIWHAKRFHMVERWGYKIAHTSCDKTFRSSYRASARHCLMQDISYVACIELNGTLERIRLGFEELRDLQARLSICAKAYVSGQREGVIDLYRRNQYPYGALGRAQFIWRKSQLKPGIHRLWLFVHPSIYRIIIEELLNVFALTRVKVATVTESCAPTYTNDRDRMSLVELKGCLNRFRLTGPLSHSVLLSALKIMPLDSSQSKPSWFSEYMSSERHQLHHFAQSEYWDSAVGINSPGELIPNMVLALNIEDPRINRPKKRTKAVPVPHEYTNGSSDAAFVIPEFNSESAIWDSDIRQRLAREKVSTHEICVHRNKDVLVPGERCDFEKKLQPIPILLIQRPGSSDSHRLGYGCGWDIIVPPTYGLSTWMCLIMWGAKAGALRETETVLREGLEDEFLPDTLSAIAYNNLITQEARAKYFRRPSSKRPNYQKLSIVSPFSCPWSVLIKEWTDQNDANNIQFYVLRDRAKLHQIEQCLQRLQNFSSLNVPDHCLIPISITMDNRGVATKYSIICLPKRMDLKTNVKKLKSFEYDPIYTEPIKADASEPLRKQLRHKHLCQLKRLRRRRIRVKRKEQEHAEHKVRIQPPKTASLIAKQLKAMSELWLPTEPKIVRHQCSREVFGYLTQCQFSFTEAKVVGIGYITVNGLGHLLKISQKSCRIHKVLVRDPNSLHYRLATLRIRS